MDSIVRRILGAFRFPIKVAPSGPLPPDQVDTPVPFPSDTPLEWPSQSSEPIPVR